MYHPLHRLGIVTATLLISLTYPLQVVGNTWGSSAVLAQTQTREERNAEALRLNKLGVQQVNQSQFREALKTFEQALVIVREIGERQGEGVVLTGIGLVYDNLGQYPKALENYQQALAIHKEVGNRAMEGTTLNNIGSVYRNLGQYPKALENYQQALAIFKQIGYKVGEGATLNNIGLVYNNLGQYPKAFENYQQALAIAKEIGDRAGEGATLNNIGAAYFNLGQYPKALENLQQALAIAKQIGNREGEGATLTGIGLVYFNLGQYPKALENYQQALAIVKQIGDRAGEGTTLNNIGLVYFNLGQYPKALENYQQALAIAKQINDRAREGATLNNIGGFYYNLGQYPKALENFQQALAIFKQIGDSSGEGTTLSNIGSVYNNQRQYPKALENFQQALAIHEEVGNKAGEGTILTGIGEVYNNLGQYPKALENYQQALAIAKEIGDRAGEGATLNNIGAAYFNLGQYPKALENLQQALAIAKQIGDRAREGATLNNIGAAYNLQGKYSQAETNLFAAIEVWESLRQRELKDERELKDDQKISIFELQAATYRFLQYSLVAQNKTNKALEISERGRARALVDLLLSKQSAADAVADETDKLSVSPTNISSVTSVNSSAATSVTSVTPSAATSASSATPSVATVAAIQQVAKQQNATLVQYSIVESQLYIWVIKPTGEIAFKQVDLKSLNTSLEELVTTSRDDIGVRGRKMFDIEVVNPGPGNPKEKLQQLHKILIAPIADFLPKNPNERVIFMPQASLFLVPFPALIDEQGKYLIEKHTILTAPSIQVLELTRKQKSRRGISPNDVLIVGNPTMPRIKFGDLESKLDPLPGAEREANAIAKFFNTSALIGSQAKKDIVKEKMERSRIIHLATHGLINDFKGFGVPGAIALAPNGKPDDLIDGLLTASEIYDMKIPADLVVLSACDTGRGDIKGDGVVGLSRSLMNAGVPSILVSLWAVNDNSTSFLMTEFYRNWQQNPDKAQALRNAMLTTMKQYPNPKQWAAFTLIGEAE